MSQPVKTWYKFHIFDSGEVTYEYTDCYDLKEDLDLLLSIFDGVGAYEKIDQPPKEWIDKEIREQTRVLRGMIEEVAYKNEYVEYLKGLNSGESTG